MFVEVCGFVMFECVMMMMVEVFVWDVGVYGVVFWMIVEMCVMLMWMSEVYEMMYVNVMVMMMKVMNWDVIEWLGYDECVVVVSVYVDMVYVSVGGSDVGVCVVIVLEMMWVLSARIAAAANEKAKSGGTALLVMCDVKVWWCVLVVLMFSMVEEDGLVGV